MTSINRRGFLKTSAAGASSLLLTSPEVSATPIPAAGSSWPQRYGSATGRMVFGQLWKDVSTNPFHHEEQATFHRLQASLDALYSRSEQPIGPLQDRPLRLSVKLLCYAEAGRTLFTLGLKSKSHGCWGFNIGA